LLRQRPHVIVEAIRFSVISAFPEVAIEDDLKQGEGFQRAAFRIAEMVSAVTACDRFAVESRR
jgi:hypothetical protein